MATNDVTGDALRTRAPNSKYDEGYARIFGKKKVETEPEVSIQDQLFRGFMDNEEKWVDSPSDKRCWHWGKFEIAAFVAWIDENYEVKKREK